MVRKALWNSSSAQFKMEGNAAAYRGIFLRSTPFCADVSHSSEVSKLANQPTASIMLANLSEYAAELQSECCTGLESVLDSQQASKFYKIAGHALERGKIRRRASLALEGEEKPFASLCGALARLISP